MGRHIGDDRTSALSCLQDCQHCGYCSGYRVGDFSFWRSGYWCCNCGDDSEFIRSLTSHTVATWSQTRVFKCHGDMTVVFAPNSSKGRLSPVAWLSNLGSPGHTRVGSYLVFCLRSGCCPPSDGDCPEKYCRAQCRSRGQLRGKCVVIPESASVIW